MHSKEKTTINGSKLHFVIDTDQVFGISFESLDQCPFVDFLVKNILALKVSYQSIPVYLIVI